MTQDEWIEKARDLLDRATANHGRSVCVCDSCALLRETPHCDCQRLDDDRVIPDEDGGL